MKRIFLIILLCIWGLSTYAQSQAQIIATINKTAATMQTMQADFTQTKHLSLLKDKMISTGKMYYQSSDKLRWEYTSPYKYTFILNGSKVSITNSNRQDVIDVNQSKMFQEIARIMMNSVVGNCLSDDTEFHVSIETKGDEWIATLLPLKKNMKQMFKKIVLHFSSSKAIVSRIELWEKNGDNTVIELKNVIPDKSISATIFAVN